MAATKKAYTFAGKDIDVTWDGRLCIHAEECVRARGKLFEVGRRDWFRQGEATADDVADVVLRCPSGSMTFRRHDDARTEEASPVNEVTVVHRGPLFVRGDLEVDGAPDDMPGVRFRAALCRCGQSDNKPFCDGSHVESGFDDPGAVGQAGSEANVEGGPLVITGAKNGPLLLSGSFRIRAASGRLAWTGTKAALCRCGHSSNKPFCDGSHREAGFTTE